MTIREQQDLSTPSDKARAALVGAAIGDALGWPQESRGGRVGRRATTPDIGFQRWTRRAGGRFFAHEEIISPGSYSDDTQLLLATARSILKGRRWLQHFVQNELPTWLVYERGGGGATKRAADAWTSGAAPWEIVKDGARTAYFQAGGNGAAMRVLPHILTSGSTADFRDISKLIFLNGMTTHGHPRALLGAILYGFVCWKALGRTGTLPYGYLLDVALKQVDQWGRIPNAEIPDGWHNDSDRVRYESLWNETVQEMLGLLSIGLKGIEAGALASDSAILKQIGAIESEASGAGTVSAAAAVYLASRYAPDPRHGVIEAAFAKGADTDTLASMAGGLLGLIAGTDWLLGAGRNIQDFEYIQGIADQLQSSICALPDVSNLPRKRSNDVKSFWTLLRGAHAGANIQLPDGRESTIERVDDLSVRLKSIRGSVWKLDSSDGQTLYVKKIEKTPPRAQSQLEFAPKISQALRPFESTVGAIKIRVSDLERAYNFYCRVLALPVARQSKNAINFGGKLTFVAIDYLGDSAQALSPSIICIETPSLSEARNRLFDSGFRSVSEIRQKGGLPYFTCKDFDGNIVEVFERAQNAGKGDSH